MANKLNITALIETVTVRISYEPGETVHKMGVVYVETKQQDVFGELSWHLVVRLDGWTGTPAIDALRQMVNEIADCASGNKNAKPVIFAGAHLGQRLARAALIPAVKGPIAKPGADSRTVLADALRGLASTVESAPSDYVYGAPFDSKFQSAILTVTPAVADACDRLSDGGTAAPLRVMDVLNLAADIIDGLA